MTLDWKERLVFTFVPFAILAIFWWPYTTLRSTPIPTDAETLLGNILFLIIGSFAVLGFLGALATFEILNHHLLKNGNCAVGKIVSVTKAEFGRGMRRQIIYSFPIGCGNPMIGKGKDETTEYSVDRPVLVFYDPDDISRPVANCSTGWRIQTADCGIPNQILVTPIGIPHCRL